MTKLAQVLNTTLDQNRHPQDTEDALPRLRSEGDTSSCSHEAEQNPDSYSLSRTPSSKRALEPITTEAVHRKQRTTRNNYLQPQQHQESSSSATVAAIENIRRRQHQKSSTDSNHNPPQQQTHSSSLLLPELSKGNHQRRKSFLPPKPSRNSNANRTIDSTKSSRRRPSVGVGQTTISSGPRKPPSTSSHNKAAYSHIKSSGYGQSSTRVPKNRRYSHIKSSGYGQTSATNDNAVRKKSPSISALRTGNQSMHVGMQKGAPVSSSLPRLGHKSNGTGLRSTRGAAALLRSGVGGVGGLRRRP